MKTFVSYAALVAALAIAGPTLAQTRAPATGAAPQSSMPGATMPSPPAPMTSTAPPAASTGSGADTAAQASAPVISGMSVKDSTGALIGDVTAVKGGVATVKMGADTFAVDTSKLGVEDGVATINATQAELKKMLPAKK